MQENGMDIHWHPAFLPVLQLELETYLPVLQFESEHQLTTEPLQIDVVIIRKEPDTVIDNPIARIFRTINIFEYKSPTVSLSIEDFHRALTYVLLYGSIHKVDITDISLSIVLTKKPVEVLRHLTEVWNCDAQEHESGIYSITGFPFPVQIIENKRLEKGYLPLLNDNLDREAVRFVLTEAQKPHKIDISAFVDVIVRANPERLEELSQMGNKTLEQVLDELGITAQVEERGKEIKAKEVAQKLIQKGWASAEIAETTELDIETVESLYKTAHA